MKVEKRFRPPHKTTIAVEVSASHIESMYDRFDSGMANHSTQNAIILALREILGTTLSLRSMKLSRDEWGIRIEDQVLPLPHEANQWMQLLADGFLVSPLRFELELSPTGNFPPGPVFPSRRDGLLSTSEVA